MESAANCPYCKGPLAGEEIRRCGECRTAHHVVCWQQNGRCSVFGCTGSQTVEPFRPAGFFPGVLLFAVSLNQGIGVILSFLFLPAMLYCLYAASRSLYTLIRSGFLRHELNRREWLWGWLSFGLNSLSLALGAWSWWNAV